MNRFVGPRYHIRFLMAEVHHETVFFSGHVQGVGFRYSVLQVAKEFEVSGFVVNLPDGRVHLEAEGETGEVAAFITAVGERMHGYIRKIERSERRRNALFVGFEIR
ncbi:MAG TPA: acylphosphatase [Opitutaceae bacterium]|nr:acylphosphatase [Opitutaceae bacterium]